MILYSGIHTFKRDLGEERPFIVEFASVSASIPSYVKVQIGNKLIEHVFVGQYSPHTWWGNNPLFGENEPKPGEEFTIEVGLNAIFRIEGKFFNFIKTES